MADAQNGNMEGVTSFRDVLQKWNDYYINTDFGIGIQCDTCKKWRRVFQYRDEGEIPEVWTCDMWVIDNNQTGDCEMPSYLTEDDFVDAKYEPGSMVWAKMGGFEWWPGMIEDCPDTQEYFLSYDDAEEEYHVTFFGDRPLRNWMSISRIIDFRDTPPPDPKRKKKTISLEKAIKQAKEAAPLSKKERLKQYSFLVRYKGPWKKIENPARVALPPTCSDVKTSEKSTESISEDTNKISSEGGSNPVASRIKLKRKLIKVCDEPKSSANQNGLEAKHNSKNPGGDEKQSPKLNEVPTKEPKRLRRQTPEFEKTQFQEPFQTKETSNFNLQSNSSEEHSTSIQMYSEWLGKLDPPLSFPSEESPSDSVSEKFVCENSDTLSENILDKSKNEAAFLEKSKSDASESSSIDDSVDHEKLRKHWEIANAILQWRC